MRVVCLGVCLLVACEARLGGPVEETPGDALPPDSTQIAWRTGAIDGVGIGGIYCCLLGCMLL